MKKILFYNKHYVPVKVDCNGDGETDYSGKVDCDNAGALAQQLLTLADRNQVFIKNKGMITNNIVPLKIYRYV